VLLLDLLEQEKQKQQKISQAQWEKLVTFLTALIKWIIREWGVFLRV
jgi:hypothetical protein